MTGRREFLKTVGLGALAGPALLGAARDNRPNVLFILVDQQRQDGVGAYGGAPVRTPHIDKLAGGGVRFNRAYTAQPVCAPNRASMFSGLCPFNHGLRENTWDLDPGVELLPQRLSRAGYRSAYFGKWHLGEPAQQAFDIFPPYPRDGRGSGHYYRRNGRRVYQTEALADDAIAFLREHGTDPFFAVVSMYPPHPPYSVPKAYEAAYAEVFPDDRHRRIYYAMCSAIDDSVGRLLGTLETLDLAENTLVVYTSEHGHFFEHRWNDHQKRLCYDETAKIPLVMRYPDRIPAGQVSDLLINGVDLSPTILSLLNQPAWPGVDGIDRSAPFTTGEPGGPPYTVFVNVPYIDKSSRPHQPVLSKGEERCIVQGKWKLILSSVRAPECYDLQSDPGERNNVYKQQRGAAVPALKASLAQWAAKTGDPLAPTLLKSMAEAT